MANTPNTYQLISARKPNKGNTGFESHTPPGTKDVPTQNTEDTSSVTANPGNNSPYPEAIKQALAAMDPRAYGMRRLGDINNIGFYERPDDGVPSMAEIVSAGIDTDLGVDYTTSPVGGSVEYANTRSKSAYNLKDAGIEPGAWMHDAGDLGIKPVMVKDPNADGLASLRSQEKDSGLLYASGKYWHTGKDGKLEAITMGMTGDAGDITQDSLGRDVDKSGWNANRQQAMQFMKNKKATSASVEELPTVEKAGKTFTKNARDKEGGSTDTSEVGAVDFRSNNDMPDTSYASSTGVNTGVKLDISPIQWMRNYKNS